MRGIQLIGVANIDLGVDPLTNKFTAPFIKQYVSDATMINQPIRKLDLFCPPTPVKLLEIHMMLFAASGTTNNPLTFGFHIFDCITGVQAPSWAGFTVNPKPMAPQIWTKIFDVTYSSAPAIQPGQYLQAEFAGFAGPAGPGNNYACTPVFRCLVAS